MPYSTVHSIKIYTARLIHGKKPRIILNTINIVNVKNYGAVLDNQEYSKLIKIFL